MSETEAILVLIQTCEDAAQQFPYRHTSDQINLARITAYQFLGRVNRERAAAVIDRPD